MCSKNLKKVITVFYRYVSQHVYEKHGGSKTMFSENHLCYFGKPLFLCVFGETHVIRRGINAFHPSLQPFGRLSKEFKALLIQFRIKSKKINIMCIML